MVQTREDIGREVKHLLGAQGIDFDESILEQPSVAVEEEVSELLGLYVSENEAERIVNALVAADVEEMKASRKLVAA
jgi:hypothetical protein